jgi:hypothetical protein
MNKMGKAITTAAIAATILTGGSAAWAYYSWTNHSRVAVSTAEAIEPAVTVLDDISRLLPGQTEPVRLKIENRNDFPVRVTKISGGSPATGECPAWAVRVTPTTDSAYAITLPRRSQSIVTIRIGMEKWADLKCAGEHFSVDLATIMGPA